MTDINRALAEIATIRSQVARAVEFRGYGPMTLAGTGALAVLAAALQTTLISQPPEHPLEYL